MHFESARQPLADILDNIEYARRTIGGMSIEDFENDRDAFYIVTRCLEIISEASRRLPEELRDRHPNIPWKEIAAAGNVYRHEYKTVQRLRVWNTVRDGLSALEAVVRQELAALPDTDD
jgi:uncharacterized protein with HEPN domain